MENQATTAAAAAAMQHTQTWTCHKCTLDNELLNGSCSVCHARRPAQYKLLAKAAQATKANTNTPSNNNNNNNKRNKQKSTKAAKQSSTKQKQHQKKKKSSSTKTATKAAARPSSSSAKNKTNKNDNEPKENQKTTTAATKKRPTTQKKKNNNIKRTTPPRRTPRRRATKKQKTENQATTAAATSNITHIMNGADHEEKNIDMVDMSAAVSAEITAKLHHNHRSGTSSLTQVMSSVVKLFVQHTKPNFSLPWQMRRQHASTSSGFVIQGRRILCNAHGVVWNSTIHVRKHGDSMKYSAQLAHIANECDLAILTVDSERFWQGLKPLLLGGLPQLQDEVICVGYPTGGDNISVTQGIVSRIAVNKYSHSDESLLAIQIDAAINAGNSGGPALVGDTGIVVGVAFETLIDAENIGYIIPVPVIQRFLEGITRTGTHAGFCTVGIYWQAIENKALRAALQLSKQDSQDQEEQGVLVCKLHPLSDAQKHLVRDDVLLRFDGTPIASDGTIQFRHHERVDWSYLLNRHFVGDVVDVSILRSGRVLNKKMKLDLPQRLVEATNYTHRPSYFIWGGFVFTVLSVPFLFSEYGDKWDAKAPVQLVQKCFHGLRKEVGEEIVVLNSVLAHHEVNTGYSEMRNTQVVRVNGEKVLNLKHLVQIVRKSAAALSKKPKSTKRTSKAVRESDFLRIDLAQDSIIFLNNREVLERQTDILKEHNIEEPGCSMDLLDI